MLMSHDEFDKLLVKYLNEKTRKNIKEILDTIKVKVNPKNSFICKIRKNYNLFDNT